MKITLDYYLVQDKKFLITLKADYFQQKNLDKALTRKPTPELATEPTKEKNLN